MQKERLKETLLGYISDATNDNESVMENPLMVMILLIL
jgi:hypothetical protein